MPALSDPKLELFSQLLLRNLARGIPKSKAAETAGKEAGYKGSSMAANSRKRANRADVKARMIELAQPAQAAAEAEVTVDLIKAKARLGAIIMADVDLDNAKAADVIAAVRQLAAIEGWNAPTSVNVTKNGPSDWSTDELVAFIADAEARLERGEAAPGGLEQPDQVH